MTVDGFTGPAIQALDITDPDRHFAVPVRVLAGENGYTASLVAPGTSERTLYAFTPEVIRRPDGIVENVPSQFMKEAGKEDCY